MEVMKKMKHRRVLKIGSLLIAAALVFSFACAPPGAEEGAEEYKAVTVGSLSFPDTLNPFICGTNSYMGMTEGVYEKLYMPVPGGEALPDLAEEIVVSPDGTIYTISLRHNAQWQDGVPLTAHDVAFSYNYIIDNEMGFFTMFTEPLVEIKALDDYTVQMTMRDAVNRDWLNNNTFLFTPILPQHIWENMTLEEALGDLPLEKLIGSGPFQFVEFARDEFVRLRVMPQAKEELGMDVDEFILKFYPETAMMVEDLRAGNIDGATIVPTELLPMMEEMPEINLHSRAANCFDEVIFNLWPDAYEEGRETRPHPALADVRIRKALDWTLDEEVAARVGYGEYCTPGYSWLGPYYGDYSNTEMECRGYDLDKARQILDDAGYLDTDGDGIREDAEGRPLEFDLQVPSYKPHQQDVAAMWVPEAAKVGIKLNFLVGDGDTMWADMTPEGKFDIDVWGWDSFPDPSWLLSLVLCEQSVEGGWGETGFCNEEYESLFKQQIVAETHEERVEIIWRMQEILHEEVAYIVYCYHGDYDGFRNDRWELDQALTQGGLNGLTSRVAIQNMKEVG